ncbi:MAG: TerB family tellurite resistance protein [Kofleriaceae bacterium]|nr:MAG: TerB family tellurite resistance protein [Kofleriaceae bacterium]MBZ0234367.1 TerB family tellurite resistance protein [Kofleriaceae bacterium]
MHLDATDFAAMDDGQRLAVLEAMVVGMIADDKITPAERRRFDEIVLGLPWGVERGVLAAMIAGARDRLAALKTPDEVHDYVEALATRLPSQALREKVVFTMATLMFSDGEQDQAEKKALGLFVVAFGITSERAAAIREALHLGGARTTAKPEATEN